MGAYDDDVVIVNRNVKELAVIFQKLELEAGEIGLLINQEKKKLYDSVSR